jgi:hypothetical protein
MCSNVWFRYKCGHEVAGTTGWCEPAIQAGKTCDLTKAPDVYITSASVASVCNDPVEKCPKCRIAA